MRYNAKYTWTKDQDRAFNQVKALIAFTPVLSRPEPGDDRFVIQTDASNFGLGAVLTENIDGQEQV